MNFLKKTLFASVLISILFGFNVVVASATVVVPNTMPCPDNLPCVSEATQAKPGGVLAHVTDTFAVRFLKGFLAIAGATAVVFIIIGGMQMILGVGNEEAIGKGKKTIIWAIFGLVIVILSVAMVNIVTNLF
ncbi:MAG: pilin [Candidatus Gracilibacteria bacterium]